MPAALSRPSTTIPSHNVPLDDPAVVTLRVTIRKEIDQPYLRPEHWARRHVGLRVRALEIGLILGVQLLVKIGSLIAVRHYGPYPPTARQLPAGSSTSGMGVAP